MLLEDPDAMPFENKALNYLNLAFMNCFNKHFLPLLQLPIYISTYDFL